VELGQVFGRRCVERCRIERCDPSDRRWAVAGCAERGEGAAERRPLAGAMHVAMRREDLLAQVVPDRGMRR